ncbi:MCE family protein [Mycolicibacterium sp.]|uniref:MCE family protein n=1 Tax=Mycolicibacterium sp. TaxID=2320850 RepID=UPI003D153504
MSGRIRRRLATLCVLSTLVTAGCEWRGINALPLPGTAGNGADALVVQAQLPDVTNLTENSRVRVGDVTVGSISRIEQQGWHALVTMRLDADVELPANATATVGQTSLLGSLHVELGPPKNEPPRGRLGNGSLIELASAGAYPTTEQTLAAFSMLLNNGGLGEVQDITRAFSVALAGREDDARNLIDQLNLFISNLNGQTDDIIAATESVNRLAGGVARHRQKVDHALETIPAALAVLRERRENLTEMLDQVGTFSALAADTTEKSKENVVKIVQEIGPVLDSLANAGPSLTRSLELFTTYPWPQSQLHNWSRGDYGNASAIFDFTLSRLDAGLLTGTRWEGTLTELELQWGRTIGQLPSPYTGGNPLIAPYRFDAER